MTLRPTMFSALAIAVVAAACTSGTIDGPGPNGTAPGATSNSDGGATSGSVSGQINFDGAPNYFRVMRLTNEQWTNSVQSILGLSSPPSFADGFQNPVSGTTDFTNNELVLDIDSRGWSDFETAAEALAKQVTSDATLLGKLYSGTDGAGFIAKVGRRIYRRPLTSTETTSYQKLFDMGPTFSGSQSDFAKGASIVLEAMLQSPYFLYRTELGAAGAPLSGYEMATKLSLWLRNTVPDDSLLDAAETAQNLTTADGAAAAAQKMLDEPGAKIVMREFHGQFLHFDKFTNLSKVGVATYDPNINPDLAEASFLFFDKIFSQGLGVKDIFTTTTGFVSSKMAGLYGGSVTAPASGFSEQPLGDHRIGFFTQLPFLMLYGHNDQPDSIHRGVSMALDVLCAPLGPPAAVIPPLPDAMPGQTNRMRVDAHTKGCGSICHNQMINPLGFAFENFDGMGQYRTQEQSGTDLLSIDSSGSFVFTDGTKTYQNATDFMNVMSVDQQVHLCYSKKLAGYGLQRSMVSGDKSLLTQLATTSLSSAGSVKQVMVELVKQDAFRVRSGGAQ